MSRNAKRAVLAGAVLAILTIAGTAMAQTSTYEIKSGEVIAVKGNNLIVKGPEGVKEFWIADDFKFDMNGKSMTVHELKPGMKLTALIKTTQTPLDLTMTELRDATVVHTIGNSIVFRNADDGKYQRFTTKEMDEMDLVVYKDGSVVSPQSLRQGDKVSALIITKLPPAIVTDQEIAVLAQKPAPPPPPPPKPAPVVVAQAAPPPPAEPPKQLPKTGSPLPLIALLGMTALAGGALMTLRRRFSDR
jgi:LPXTG-motif cell wall-anchored protein